MEGPCAVCGTQDRRVLALVDLEGRPVVLCANDQALLGPLVETLDELRAEAALAAGLRLEVAQGAPARVLHLAGELQAAPLPSAELGDLAAPAAAA